MDQRQVVAEWAWIAKEPGSPADYGVLAASAGPTDVEGFTGAYVAGVPSSGTPGDAPAAAPWVTFGSHLTSAGQHLLSVSAQDPWRGQDQAGRPIWPRRFFLCRYDELAAARASYRTLWDAVAALDLPRPDRRPVPVAVRQQSLGAVLAVIDDVGFDRVAAIAAALLDGPVAVTGAASLRLADPSAAWDRLAVLDAVAALLPYGFRADLSASTAVDNTVLHRMRLILAEYANGGQQAAALTGAPVAPRSGLACDYLTMLRDKQLWDGLKTVVTHLRDAAGTCSFGHPETALEILDGLNRHRHRVRAATLAAESLEASRAFFRDEPARVAQAWRSAEMDEPTRGKLLRPFLEADEPDLAQTLHRHWDAVAQVYAALAVHRLDDGDIGGAMRGLVVAGSQPDPGAADWLLRNLIQPPPVPAQAWPLGIATRAELLRRRPVPTPDTFGMTGAALRLGPPAGWQGQLVRKLLGTEMAADPAGGRALAWVSWLAGPPAGQDAPGWVTALGYLVADTGGDRPRNHVRSLARQDPDWAAIMVDLARRAGRLHDLLGIPGVADEIIGPGTGAWTRPAVGPAEAASLLRGSVEQVIANPAALRRYVDERYGVPGSRLALDMYRARKSGMPAAQIIELMRVTSVNDLTLTRAISHRELDDVLRECEFLLACPARAAGDAPAGDMLGECRTLICSGALGAHYGAAFRRALNTRLKDEEAASRRLRLRLRRLSRSFGRGLRRPSAPASALVEHEAGEIADARIVR